MANETIGSWFSSGYHGHYRSKSRNDFVCEYRQLSKPQPPNRFLYRSKETANKHVFSKHDNRQCFLNDALLFEQGLGRKRVPNQTYNFKKDFLTWMPEREYVERSYPLSSCYEKDYSVNRKRASQLIVKRPKTSFDGVPTSTYRYSHGKMNPNRDAINAMNNDALQLGLLHRKNRAMTAKSHRSRESVASCLTWRSSGDQDVQQMTTDPATSKKLIPAATACYAPDPTTQSTQPSVVSSESQSPQYVQAPLTQVQQVPVTSPTLALPPPTLNLPPPPPAPPTNSFSPQAVTMPQAFNAHVGNHPPPRPKTAHIFIQNGMQSSPPIMHQSANRRLSLDMSAVNRPQTTVPMPPSHPMPVNSSYNAEVISPPIGGAPNIVWIPPRQLVQCAQ